MRYELFLSARGRLANEAEGGRTFYDVLSETIEDRTSTCSCSSTRRTEV